MKSNNTIQPTYTIDALDALEKAGLSRRTFLQGTGAMIVGFSTAGAAGVLATSEAAAAGAPLQGSTDTRDKLDSWIAIQHDGTILAYTGKSDLGTGMFTVQVQLVAEYLEVPLSRVKLTLCDTALTPDQGTTSGSQSHRANFNHQNRSLMTAAATALHQMKKLAAERFGVTVDDLVVRNGVIIVKNDATKNATYGELVGGKLFSIELDPTIKIKGPKEWTILGTSVPRLDLPDMVTGRYEFAWDVRVPGMLYGRVVRPPRVDAKVISVDESSVADIPGLIKVVVKNDFVGVVAEKPYQAIRAAERLKVEWTRGLELPDQATFYEWMLQQPRTNSRVADSLDVDEKLASAAKVIQATYYIPYNMHGSLGASAAVADVRGDTATVWSPTQGVHNNERAPLATLLGIPLANVRVIWKLGSGCYGLNGADAVSFDAALLSQALQRPVMVQLTRRDEMAWENFGTPYVHKNQLGLDAAGNIIAWDSESWTAGKGGRPGANTPQNVVTGNLAGFAVAPFNPSTGPGNVSTSRSNSSNHVPNYIAFVKSSGEGGPAYLGTVTSERITTHGIRSPFWTGPLRSPNRLQNTFAHESVIDEAAAYAKADPVEYRLRYIVDDDPLTGVVNANTFGVSGTRMKDCIKLAAEKFGWERRASPKAGNPKTGVVTGQGFGAVLYEGYNGYCAVAAEVEVNQDTGVVRITRMNIATDTGPISNPNGIENQNEGGALQGMSRALGEEVTWDHEKITTIDWITYPTWSFSHGVPEIANHLINRTDGQPATGAGEVSITVMFAVIANGIFDATGVRIREALFTPAKVLAALKAAG
ncbi:MAG: xanthine dehydrogenase family protein molybdopterin-binding subunit [Acidobacteria bacterium]|nr:xanthine dehydrogenase family protein molybdopterin-binding subunit [Acidobacteriota bacterium]